MSNKKIILHLCADIGSDSLFYQLSDEYEVIMIGEDIGVENYIPPTNAYTTKWTPEECPICNFIDKNQDIIKYNYKLLLNHV